MTLPKVITILNKKFIWNYLHILETQYRVIFLGICFPLESKHFAH